MKIEWKEKDGELKPFYKNKRGENIDVAWAPMPGSQQAFLECPIFEVLYEGTRGPGKTDALLMDFGQHINQGFGAEWRGILFRQSYPQLSDIVAKTKKWFYRIWPDNAVFNEQKMTWTWNTGEQLLLRHMAKEEDYWSYHGHSYPWIGWEEITTWPDPICYKRMMSCSRSILPQMPRKYRATTNPYGVGHNWVKARWNLRTLTGKQLLHKIIKPDDEPPRVAIRGYLSENIVLAHADPGYEKKIRAAARNPAELEAWINGSWDIVAGGMFDDVWNPAKHIVPNFEVPHSWRLNRSFDWGSSKPFSVGWWAESDGTDVIMKGKKYSTIRGDLFRVAEWYGWTGQPNEGLRMTAKEIAQGILERERRWFPNHRVNGGPADSSIYDRINNISIAEDMEAVGVYWERADKSPGSRKQGWEKMRGLLKAGLIRPREDPTLFVCTDCDQFLRTIPVLPRSDRDLDDVNSEAEDHIADETRYRVLTRSEHIQIHGMRGR